MSLDEGVNMTTDIGTGTRMAADPGGTDLDLTAPLRLAQGSRQLRWLRELLLTPGLNTFEATGRYSLAARRDVHRFINSLRVAGYDVRQDAPGGYLSKWRLFGHIPAQGWLLQAYSGPLPTLLADSPYHRVHGWLATSPSAVAIDIAVALLANMSPTLSADMGIADVLAIAEAMAC
jgi:hypothetical protein